MSSRERMSSISDKNITYFVHSLSVLVLHTFLSPLSFRVDWTSPHQTKGLCIRQFIYHWRFLYSLLGQMCLLESHVIIVSFNSSSQIHQEVLDLGTVSSHFYLRKYLQRLSKKLSSTILLYFVELVEHGQSLGRSIFYGFDILAHNLAPQDNL